MSVPYQIGKERLKNLFFDQGVDLSSINTRLTSDGYVLPSRQWFFGPFAEYWTKLRRQLFPAGYHDGRSVCHHFTQGCVFHAGRCSEFTKDAVDKTLLVGEFWYFNDEMGGEHSQVIALVHDEREPDADPGFVFMEPQTSAEYVLTPKEFRSCEFFGA